MSLGEDNLKDYLWATAGPCDSSSLAEQARRYLNKMATLATVTTHRHMDSYNAEMRSMMDDMDATAWENDASNRGKRPRRPRKFEYPREMHDACDVILKKNFDVALGRAARKEKDCRHERAARKEVAVEEEKTKKKKRKSKKALIESDSDDQDGDPVYRIGFYSTLAGNTSFWAMVALMYASKDVNCRHFDPENDAGPVACAEDFHKIVQGFGLANKINAGYEWGTDLGEKKSERKEEADWKKDALKLIDETAQSLVKTADGEDGENVFDYDAPANADVYNPVVGMLSTVSGNITRVQGKESCITNKSSGRDNIAWIVCLVSTLP